MRERALGMVLLVIALGAGYMGVIWPLDDAAAHKTSVTISVKLTVFVPLLLVYSLIYLALGQTEAQKLLGKRDSPTPLNYVLGIGLLGAGFLLYIWMKSGLQNAGYQF